MRRLRQISTSELQPPLKYYFEQRPNTLSKIKTRISSIAKYIFGYLKPEAKPSVTPQKPQSQLTDADKLIYYDQHGVQQSKESRIKRKRMRKQQQKRRSLIRYKDISSDQQIQKTHQQNSLKKTHNPMSIVEAQTKNGNKIIQNSNNTIVINKSPIEMRKFNKQNNSQQISYDNQENMNGIGETITYDNGNINQFSHYNAIMTQRNRNYNNQMSKNNSKKSNDLSYSKSEEGSEDLQFELQDGKEQKYYNQFNNNFKRNRPQTMAEYYSRYDEDQFNNQIEQQRKDQVQQNLYHFILPRKRVKPNEQSIFFEDIKRLNQTKQKLYCELNQKIPSIKRDYQQYKKKRGSAQRFDKSTQNKINKHILMLQNKIKTIKERKNGENRLEKEKPEYEPIKFKNQPKKLNLDIQKVLKIIKQSPKPQPQKNPFFNQVPSIGQQPISFEKQSNSISENAHKSLQVIGTQNIFGNKLVNSQGNKPKIGFNLGGNIFGGGSNQFNFSSPQLIFGSIIPNKANNQVQKNEKDNPLKPLQPKKNQLFGGVTFNIFNRNPENKKQEQKKQQIINQQQKNLLKAAEKQENAQNSLPQNKKQVEPNKQDQQNKNQQKIVEKVDKVDNKQQKPAQPKEQQKKSVPITQNPFIIKPTGNKTKNLLDDIIKDFPGANLYNSNIDNGLFKFDKLPTSFPAPSGANSTKSAPNPSIPNNNIFGSETKKEEKKEQFSTPTKNIFQKYSNPQAVQTPLGAHNAQAVQEEDESSMFDQSQSCSKKQGPEAPIFPSQHQHSVVNNITSMPKSNMFLNINNINQQDLSKPIQNNNNLLLSSPASAFLSSIPLVDKRKSVEMFAGGDLGLNNASSLWGGSQQNNSLKGAKKSGSHRNKKQGSKQQRIYD